MNYGYVIFIGIFCLYLFSLYIIIKKNVVLANLKQKKNILYSISQNICINKEFISKELNVFTYFKEVFLNPLIKTYKTFTNILSIIVSIIFLILLLAISFLGSMKIDFLTISLYSIILLTCILFFAQSSIKIFSEDEENILKVFNLEDFKKHVNISNINILIKQVNIDYEKFKTSGNILVILLTTFIIYLVSYSKISDKFPDLNLILPSFFIIIYLLTISKFLLDKFREKVIYITLQSLYEYKMNNLST